jgi:hypothetical protein
MNFLLRPQPLVLMVVLLLAAPPEAAAAPSLAEMLTPDVCLVRDDTGTWGGMTTGMTHQRGPDYWAKKVFDLSQVPEAFWKSVTRARLSAFFTVRDYSARDLGKANGLDEAFEIVVNGKVQCVPTNSGVPVFLEHVPAERCFRWHDFEVPRAHLVRGPNEIIFRMIAPKGKTPDDYLYLGIDNTVPGGNSWVRFSKGSPWRQDQITVPTGGKGEYMVRLYLLRDLPALEATWRPRHGNDDPDRLFDYAGARGAWTRIEWDPERLDSLSPATLTLEIADNREFNLSWLDGQGKLLSPPAKVRGSRQQVTLSAPLNPVPGGLLLPAGVPVQSIRLTAGRNYHPRPGRIDMAPHIQPARGTLAQRQPSCTIGDQHIRLAGQGLRCEFDRSGGRLRLTSLFNEIAAREMVQNPDHSALMLVEVSGKRYAASADFQCRSVAPLEGRQGFRAVLFCKPIGLEAVLQVWIDEDLHLTATVTNRAGSPLNFKLAFPHLSGLVLSDSPAGDYYFFPWGGGIIADVPAIIRRGYGDHEAIYQVMDLFSPSRGAGLSIRCTDADGRHKVLALRKHVSGRAMINGDVARTPVAPEYCWTNSLPSVPGIGLTYEYLRRTRKPGAGFTPPEVVLTAHAGDWHAAMKSYADWCHRTWRFRPFPSRLGPVSNMIATGWGQDALFRNGKYRTDFLRPRCDCIELMSWWDWSPLGPQGVPLDRYGEIKGPGKLKEWASYFVKDPVTGRLMFNNNPGDYDGYNERFGGLPAFREAIRSYQKTGTLVTLYTDPLRVDENTKCGRQWGKSWGVVGPDGKYRTDYDAFRMCHDVADYRRFVADAMGRVLRETGADGIRLDEYGHCGSACSSSQHKHTFAEPGLTEWQRGIAETTRLVREAMDQVRPNSVLTTEHPGYDFLMPFIEGCITYDLSVQATPLRPMECNLQRFYFPECKAFELVYDPQRSDGNHHRRFWNAVGSFGAYYPPAMYRILAENDDAFSSRDSDPLVPTRMQFVYANRFRGPGKVLYTLYNAAGHTIDGPVLAPSLRPDEHVFDLLQCREAQTTSGPDGKLVHLDLERDGVACLACLRVRLSVQRSGDVLEATVHDTVPGGQLRICDNAGEPLLSVPVANKGPTKLNLASLGPKLRTAACVKLLNRDRLVDVVDLKDKK